MGPVWLLLFLAPAIGELLSGSSPPRQFFQPLGLAMLVALYGVGALLIREWMVRWGRGWRSLLVLGAAYGVIEEGLMVKSFFDPHWKDLGPLGTYGRWVGVNWVWAFQLSIYHAIFSIATPILLTELVFPGRRGTRWISDRAMKLLSALFVLNGILVFFAITPYRPPAPQYLGAVVVTLLLIWAASQQPALPAGDIPDSGSVPSSPLRFWMAGFLGTVALFLFSWVLPYTPVPPVGTIVITLGLVWMMARLLSRMSGSGQAWDDRRRMALAAGGLSFFIALGVIQQLKPATAGRLMGIVAVAAVAGLLWLRARVARNPWPAV